MAVLPFTSIWWLSNTTSAQPLPPVDGKAGVFLMTVLHCFVPNKIRHSVGGCWSELGFHCLGWLEQHVRAAVAVELTSCLGSSCDIITCWFLKTGEISGALRIYGCALAAYPPPARCHLTNCHRLSRRTAKRLGAIDRVTTCKANPEEGNIIKQQAQTRLDCHQVTKQQPLRTTGANTPRDHRGERGGN